MKKLLIVPFILWCSFSYAAAPVRPAGSVAVANTTISSASYNGDLNPLYNYLIAGVDTYLAGSISNIAISSTAAIVASKLDLTSPGAIGSSTANTGAFTTLGATGTSTLVGINASGAYTQSGSGIDYFSGNVGIGSVAPDQSLVVNGGNIRLAGTNSMYFGNDSASSSQRIASNASTSGDIGIITNNSTRISITNGGNIGISSVNPGQFLDIQGNIREDGSFQLFFGNDNKASIQASALTTPDIRFFTNLVEIMRITNAGNVGISSVNPGQQLDVGSGRIRAVGIGTTTPQELCRKSDGTFGYFDGAWVGTCN